MMERHDVPHRAQPDLVSAGGSCDRVEVGRRHPALIGAEMMLDAKAVIKAELVSHLKLAPQLLVALRRGHTSFIPHMGEMRKFHNGIASFPETPTLEVAKPNGRGEPLPIARAKPLQVGLGDRFNGVVDASLPASGRRV